MQTTKTKQRLGIGLTVGVLLGALLAPLSLPAATIHVPAGSVDALAAAIASAGPSGTVVLESGTHHESGTVTVTEPVSIVGEAGAILIVATDPSTGEGWPDNIQPAIHILDASQVTVAGLDIQPPEGNQGNTGVLVQNAPETTLQGNAISHHQYGIVVRSGDDIKINGNQISDMIFGLIVMNGNECEIVGNQITGVSAHGMFLSGTRGKCFSNVMSDCFLGILLCTFPQDSLVLPDGSQEGAEISATGWHLIRNTAHHNFIGYVVADAANHNILANNAAWNNELADIILDGEYQDPYEAPSYENVLAVGSHQDLTVWDLGVDNIVSGNVTVGP